MRRFSLGSLQFATLVAGLLMIACIFSIVIAPELSDWHARMRVEAFQNQFGFITGMVRVPDGHGAHFER
jgi:hypothetical protein